MDSFNTKSILKVGAKSYHYFSLEKFEQNSINIQKLPFSLKILLENLLRHEDAQSVTKEDIEVLAGGSKTFSKPREIAFRPSRVLLQDFTGVPAIVDLALMRDAMKDLGGDPSKINPLLPSELVIDHSVQVDAFGTGQAFKTNAKKEFERNVERYGFLRWGQNSFNDFKVVPPDTGIVHQINLEYLARVVFEKNGLVYPDTLVGTDSHTTMINGLGVLGWGVGGIEAEAAMLGQPISMLIPEVIGFKLKESLPEGATATDLVLTVTSMLREKGVVGKFVEFFGEGLEHLSLADRATLGNMSPEYGATCAIFPIDDQTLKYLRLSGRSDENIELVEAYAKAQGLFRTTEDPDFTDTLELDLSSVAPCISGPKRPQDRVELKGAKQSFEKTLSQVYAKTDKTTTVSKKLNGSTVKLKNGSVVIAAITSCTNTSNPHVMMGAGLVAQKAIEKGLNVPPYVKTSLAPGSMVVTEYLKSAGLFSALEGLGFHLVGYGCTTCIGNSGPLHPAISEGIQEGNLIVVSVLSGNRNFEGRIHSEVKANYLASPPLVVAYALSGRMDIDFYHDPIGQDQNGGDVYLKDIWPTQEEIQCAVNANVTSEMFKEKYKNVFEGDEAWKSLKVPEGDLFSWDPKSTYVRQPTFFAHMKKEPEAIKDIKDARVLALFGDSVTTDHISPAGTIKVDSSAGKYLIENGVNPKDFNSYGSRRGNHEVMMRGTFANIRIRNKLVPGVEGGFTRFLPTNEQMSIYDAAMRYQTDKTSLIVIAGKEYGSGSSRDWAAKGTYLLGVRAVMTRSFERIHRSNLIGMGVLPLEFLSGEDPETLGLTGEETFDINGIANHLTPGKELTVSVKTSDGRETQFQVKVRIDTPLELEYYQHGGILNYVLRQLL